MTQDKQYTCKSCKEPVQKDANKCPHCGEKHPTISNAKGCLGLVVLILIGTAMLSMCTDDQGSNTAGNAQENAIQTQPKWYENGGLHDKSALDWQIAPYKQKLATAADIYAHFYQKKQLTPAIAARIESVDDLRPYAENLVSALNEAFEKKATKEENQKMYANQTVSETSILLLTMQGHIKL